MPPIPSVLISALVLIRAAGDDIPGEMPPAAPTPCEIVEGILERDDDAMCSVFWIGDRPIYNASVRHESEPTGRYFRRTLEWSVGRRVQYCPAHEELTVFGGMTESDFRLAVDDAAMRFAVESFVAKVAADRPRLTDRYHAPAPGPLDVLVASGLSDRRDATRRAVREFLADRGERAIPALVGGMMGSEDAEVRWSCKLVLERIRTGVE